MTWKTVKLTEIATISTGKWDANHASENGKYRFYTCASKHMYSETKRFSGNCIILPGNGANVGDVYYYEGDFDAYQRTYIVHDIKISPKFLMYHMKMNWSKLNKNKQYGSATNFIKIGNFKDYNVSYPSLKEQQRIVTKFDAAFAEINKAIAAAEKNFQDNKKLFELIRDEVYGDAVATYPNVELDTIANLSRGHNPPKRIFINEPRDGYLRFFQIRDARSNKFATYVPDSKKLSKVSERDFLMNAYRHIGEVYRGVSGAFNVALCKLEIKDFTKICDDYLFYMIPSYLIKGKLLKTSARSLIPSMSIKELAKFKIPIPSISEQEIIANKITKIKSYSQQLESLYQNKVIELSNLKSAILVQKLQSEAA